VLGKAPVPGKVKTRLTRGPNALTPEAAAAGAGAMMRATLDRVGAHTAAEPNRRILAIDRPELTPQWVAESGWAVMDQGGGSLGDRIGRAWERAGPGPVAFFGVDCPDVPAEALAAIGPALARADAAVGPVDDGGYWPLAAGRPRRELLRGIDWGSDHPEDLTALRARLRETAPRDAALARLDDALNRHAAG